MTRKHFEKFTEMLTALTKFHPRTAIDVSDADTVSGYFEALAPMSLRDVARLFALARDRCEFFPSPATLRNMAGLNRSDEPCDARTANERAEISWSLVTQHFDGKPYNLPALHRDPIAMQVFREMGGSYALDWGFGRWSADQDTWKRKEYISNYAALVSGNRPVVVQVELSQGDAEFVLDKLGINPSNGITSE